MKERNHTMRLKLVIRGMLPVLLLLLCTEAYAQLVIDVDPSMTRKYPIAVAQTKLFEDGKGDKEFETKALNTQKILMNDLAIAGIFEVLNPKSFLENSKTAGISQAQIDFTQWLQVGADYLVKAGIWNLGEGKIKIDARLFDVTTGTEKVQKTYEGKLANIREAMHNFADQIMFFFTKQQSIFSTKIVAVKKYAKTKQIYIVDFDGENGYAVTKNNSINLLPTWSPDGKSIYFTSYMNNNPDLYRLDLGSKKAIKISSYRGLNVGASISPDATKIALTLSKDGNSELYVMDINGSNLKRITHSHAIDSSPAWAPDNRTLAFVSDRSGYPQIYKVDVNGGTPVRLTFQGNYNQSPAWSPKGDKIVFCGRDERLVFDLFLVDPETREITRLTQDEGNNEDPAWAPDGKHIVFASTRTGSSQLFIMSNDGSNQKQITSGKGTFSTPDWSPIMKVMP